MSITSVKVLSVSVLLWLLFSGYYLFLSTNLPIAAGPDEEVHYFATRFIHTNARLAIYPNDKEDIHKTPYGTSRSFREPLSYLVSAIISKSYVKLSEKINWLKPLPQVGQHSIILYRKGNALISAITVTLIFGVVFLLSNSIAPSVIAASAFGLMPQTAFLASYNNNDAMAVFVYALLLFSVISFLKFPQRLMPYLLGGISAGLVMISKPTIWLCSFIVLLLIIYLALKKKTFQRLLLLSLPAFIVVAPWWFIHNGYHHGMDNLRNKTVKQALISEYNTLTPDAIKSYADIGLSGFDLLTNKEQFLNKTYKSTVGMIDLIRLPMGEIQYLSYALIMSIGLLCLIYLSIFTVQGVKVENFRLLAGCLLLGFIAQFCIYIWWNLNFDQQPQGRYLIPSLIIAFLGFGLFVHITLTTLTEISKMTARLIATLLLFFAPLVNLHAMYSYVVPYYKPGMLYKINDNTKRINLADANSFVATNDVILQSMGSKLKITATGVDPWIMLNTISDDKQTQLQILTLKLESKSYDVLKIYWNDGRGYSETHSQKYALRQPMHEIKVEIPGKAKQFRIDLGESNTNQFTIFSINLASGEYRRAKIKHVLDFLNKKISMGN